MPLQMQEQRKNKSYFQPDQIHQAGNNSNNNTGSGIHLFQQVSCTLTPLIIIGPNPQPSTRSSALRIQNAIMPIANDIHEHVIFKR
ncbi:hypothetical protein QE439_003815 [Pedobacter agri]|nr:hypothetical protein [Pedobacter agri]